jgi:hypothetical protein
MDADNWLREIEKKLESTELTEEECVTVAALQRVGVGHTPRVLMQGRKKSRRRTPTRIPMYSY